MWYFEEGSVVFWRGWCGTLKMVMWYFEEGGVVLWRRVCGTLKRVVVLWRGWCCTLKRVMWYFEEGSVVLWRRVCGTLKRVVVLSRGWRFYFYYSRCIIVLNFHRIDSKKTYKPLQRKCYLLLNLALAPLNRCIIILNCFWATFEDFFWKKIPWPFSNPPLPFPNPQVEDYASQVDILQEKLSKAEASVESFKSRELLFGIPATEYSGMQVIFMQPFFASFYIYLFHLFLYRIGFNEGWFWTFCFTLDYCFLISIFIFIMDEWQFHRFGCTENRS